MVYTGARDGHFKTVLDDPHVIRKRRLPAREIVGRTALEATPLENTGRSLSKRWPRASPCAGVRLLHVLDICSSHLSISRVTVRVEGEQPVAGRQYDEGGTLESTDPRYRVTAVGIALTWMYPSRAE